MFPIPDELLEAEARTFAYLAHASVDHYRKTTFAPYVYHLEEVALLVKQTQGYTVQMVAAALLHDVLEDTPVTKSQLQEKFGADVSYLVEGLSDISTLADGTRAKRKEIDRLHYASGDWRIHTIKVCDTISNTRDIVKNDPSFARVYLPEIRELLKLLIRADLGMRALAIELANQEIPEDKVMGGNALKLDKSVRMDSWNYHSTWMNMREALAVALPETTFEPIPSYLSKPDFGDMDILMENYPQDAFEKIYSALNATEGIRNGDVYSFGYPLEGEWKGKVFQIDFIKTKTFDWSKTYFGFNDLGDLMGRVSKKLGFKYGHDGLWYVLRDLENSTRVIEEILITSTDLAKAFSLIGYNYEAYLSSDFEEIEDIYKYAASNEYFDLSVYLPENRPHHERIRARKRKVYVGFLEWCKTQTFPEVPDEYKDVSALRTTKLEEAFKLFPEFKVAYDKAIGLDKMKRQARALFTPQLVTEVTGAVGKQLGLVMGGFKACWFTPEHFNHWCVIAGEEVVRATFKEWWAKASKHKNSELMLGFNLHA